MKTTTDPFGGTKHDASTALSPLELADAAQAATDTRGWQSRLQALLVKYVKRADKVEQGGEVSPRPPAHPSPLVPTAASLPPECHPSAT